MTRAPATAIIRRVPRSFKDAVCAVPPWPPIDVMHAREQHAEYRGALERCGLEVRALAADDACPDCCFIEDTAVVADGVALVTRPGATSRRDETEAVAKILGDYVEIARMAAPMTLDGGDCMRVGTKIFAGQSLRTSGSGIERLAEVFTPRGFQVIPVALPAHVLHLKCICAPLGDDRITLVEGTPREPFAGLGIVDIPAAESYAANVVAVGNHVLVARGFPRTAEALERAGFDVIALDTSEFRKADGSLTCLSLLL
jgi:dimethylargininase